MELELNWARFNHYDRLQDICLSQEETQELIVPDANPDIREIVEAGGQLFLTEKTVQEGGLVAGGRIEGWVLYRPDGEGPLCRMDVRVPVSVKSPAADCSANCKSVVRPVLCRMDARTLNPRKVLVKAEVQLDVQLYEPKVLAVCSDIKCEEAAGVQKLTDRHSAYLTTQVREKAFSVYEEVHAPVGLDGQESPICLGARVWCTEKKLIGTKLVFKGEAGVRMRYPAGEKLLSVTVPVNFSQVIELEETGEQGDCRVELYVTGLTCTMAGEDGRTMNITLDLLAQAVACEQTCVDLLQDAYATNAQLELETENCRFARLLSSSATPQAMRELLETQVQAKSVVDADIRVCQVNVVRQADTTQVQAQLQADVLYLDELDQLHGIARTILATGQMDVPDDAVCNVSCTCPGEVFTAITTGGIEVRFSLEFAGVLTRLQPAVMVTQAQLKQRCRDGQRRPSAVLRMPMPGERLWDIAKAYSTTMEQICQANALEEADLPSGRLLLIPSGC